MEGGGRLDGGRKYPGLGAHMPKNPWHPLHPSHRLVLQLWMQAVAACRRVVKMDRGVGHDLSLLDGGRALPGVKGSEPESEEVVGGEDEREPGCPSLGLEDRVCVCVYTGSSCN